MAGIAAAIGGAFGQLGLLAAQYGLMELADAWKNKRVSEDPTIYGLQSRANALIDAASKKGDKVLRAITRRLEAITKPFGISDALNAYINKARKKLVDKQGLVNDVQDAISRKSNEITGLVSTHEMTSTSGKLGSLGETLRSSVAQKENQLAHYSNKLSEIEKTV